jgi:UDP-N-acetylmuramoyl-L-alanyl-D-glutamate--2,6-diaminopimelate ligase
MAFLKDILYKVSLKSVFGSTGIEVRNICFDSRKATEGDLFIAVKGTHVDGHQFIDDVVKKGAVAIVAEQLPEHLNEEIVYIQVENSARALGIIAGNFYGNPSGRLFLVAVTGTNGKTTIATLLHQLFLNLGYNVGLLSTVTNKINEDSIEATHTTGDSVQINKLLSQMVAEGCTHCFMEASSHAIVQERIAGLQFIGAVFTNISRDHLDYHHTFKDYIDAKKKLFDELSSSAFALVNADDKHAKVMLQNSRARKYTYGFKTMTDYKGKILSNTLQGLEVEIDGKIGWFKLIGDFNAYNLLAVYGTAALLGENIEEILLQLTNLSGATGRFEQIFNPYGITAIVDYAHTPDALENVLTTIKKIRTGNEKLITVIGCGGDRDKGKRPMMAGVAVKNSDKVILTSDNPRSEDPKAIIDEMWKGINPTGHRKTLEIVDRKEAIKTACTIAEKGDILLIAGKGHETYQEIKGVKYPFDDKQIVAEMLNLMFG